jgi:hypothetical protein
MTEVVETPPIETPPVETPPIETPAAPEWLGTLPDDLKVEPTLARYKDVEALARGHLDTQKLARSKLSVPGEGATDEDWGKIFDAIGRPESADKYDLAMPQLPVDATDKERTALAEGYKPYRELAYQLGLTATQAKALTEFDLKRSADHFAKGEEEIGELKIKLGRDYEPKRAAAQKAFTQLFGDDAEGVLLADEIDRKVGSARMVKGMMRLAEIMGEHKIIESDEVEGFGEVADADAKLDALQSDKTWREKLEAGDATVVAQRKRLMELAVQQAQRRQPTARTA